MNGYIRGFDLVYRPSSTKFMRMVKDAGGKAYHGLKMLLYQGIAAYELWNSVSVSEEDALMVYGRMKEAMGNRRMKNIILTGFMGCGKTSVGIRLSYRVRRTMTDTDRKIRAIIPYERVGNF